MTEREALKLALDAFGEIAWSNETQWQRDRAKEAITAIKKALAQPEHEWVRGECVKCGQSMEQPEQEPVAWTLLLVGEHHGIIGKAGETFATSPEYYRRVDVYTTPPQRKPLTDEEERKAFEQWYVCNAFDYERNPIGSRECGLQWSAWKARAAHGIKGEA